MENKSTARAALRAALAARDTASKELAASGAALERGRELVSSAAARLAEYKREQEIAERELSARIASRLRAGAATAELEAAPSPRGEAAAQAHAQHLAAQRAAEQLAGDVQSARHNLQTAQARVRECAAGVLAEEADRRATELRAARAIVSSCENWIRAAAALPLGALGRGLVPAANVALEAPPFYPLAEAGLQRRVRAYLTALETDAAAAWGAIPEPPAPAQVLSTLFKPSSATVDQKTGGSQAA